MKIITNLNLFFIILVFHFCSDNYSTEIRDSIINEFASNQNVVSINHYYDIEDWKNVMDFDVTLKNDVRMYIAECQYDKDKNLVYESVYDINGWWLREIIHYETEDKYDSSSAYKKKNELMGNSVRYLLDNYQELCDFYMSAPEFDPVPYNTLKETFDNAPDKCMYDIYDENGKLIGVSKLYRWKEQEVK